MIKTNYPESKQQSKSDFASLAWHNFYLVKIDQMIVLQSTNRSCKIAVAQVLERMSSLGYVKTSAYSWLTFPRRN